MDHRLALIGAAATALALLVLVVVMARVARQRSRVSGRAPGRGRALENVLTFAAAGVATGVAAVGMWRFFGDVLEIESVYLRSALFAFLEISLFVSAIRARRNLLDDSERLTADRVKAEAALEAAVTEADRETAKKTVAAVVAERPSTGVDGIAVWVLAGMSGVFAAMDTTKFAEAVFRLVAPLVAAWLWERGMAAERRRHRRGSGQINWRITPERVLVALGIAEPSGRAVGEVDAARRKAMLARSAYRLHMLRAFGAWSWRISLATWRLRRQIQQAAEHIGLASDVAVRQEVRVHLATMYQVVEGTSPQAVADLAPWSSPEPADRTASVLVAEEPADGQVGSDDGEPPLPVPVSPTVSGWQRSEGYSAGSADTADEPGSRAPRDRDLVHMSAASTNSAPESVSEPAVPRDRDSAAVPSARRGSGSVSPVRSAARDVDGAFALARESGDSLAGNSKKARFLALLEANVGADDKRIAGQLAAEFAPRVNLHEGTARRHAGEWLKNRAEARRRRLRTV